METAGGLSRRALFGAGLGRVLDAHLAAVEAPRPPRRTAAPAPAFAGWGEDDAQGLGARLHPVADGLVAAAGVGPGTRVRVLGAPDGVLAAAVARAGGTPWASGDADAVLSLFGASYAPDPRALAAGLVDAVRPGGMIAFTAWSGLVAEIVERAGGCGDASRRWTQFEAAYRHFFDFPELDVREQAATWTFADAEAASAALGGGDAELFRCFAVPSGGDACTVRATYAIVAARRP